MSDQMIQTIRDYFTTQPIEKAWIFCSYVRGEEHKDSDVDLLVTLDSKANVDLLQYVHIINELKRLLNKEVDMVVEMFCKEHNKVEDYQSFFQLWSDKEMANTALTLCYQTDSMLNKTLLRMEKEFVEQGGIKERMHAARTGYRQAQDAELTRLRAELPALRQELTRLKALLTENGIAF